MNKLQFILSVVLILCSNVTLGQTTYYYKLTKKIQDGVEYTNTAGGQFISFINNTCYDSDKFGISVGNGKLTLDKEYSKSSKTYIGNSYFGNAVYRFKSDLSVLNIIVNKNLIYVYKRTTPDSDVVTCSLIRKKNNTSTPNVNVNTPYYPANMPYNGGYTNTTPTTTTNTNTSTSNTQNNVKRYRDCVFCEGGRIEHNDNPVAHFGLEGTWKKCNECGKTYNTSSCNHYHTSCSHCRGTGQVLVEQ